MTNNDETADNAFAVVALTPITIVDGGNRSAGAGVLLQVRTALAPLPPGAVVEVRSTEPSVREDLAAWCRLTGNALVSAADAGAYTTYFVRKGGGAARWDTPDWGIRMPQRREGTLDLRDWFTGRRATVPDEASTYFGFIPRGAVAEPGLPEYPFRLNHKADVWVDTLADLYEQATAQQWNASTDIPWSELRPLPDDLERAVCQAMTFLAENEYAALYIPAKFLPRINAQYIEAVLFLSTVINDEARHIEAFTKRALANGGGLQVAAALTEWSLYSLLIQEDYFRSSFLLHVLGEGTFLDLLEFIEQHAPEPVTAEIVRRARLDEGRHVAYGIAHVREQLRQEPARVDELIAATEERAAALQATTGANPVLMEALAVLAGGGAAPDQMARGLAAVRSLFQTMAEHRVRRLRQIGLDRATAEQLSALHTPNFM
ncbi:MAG: sulfurtransferase TusA family protein [Dehalococcoidia bacterium]